MLCLCWTGIWWSGILDGDPGDTIVSTPLSFGVHQVLGVLLLYCQSLSYLPCQSILSASVYLEDELWCFFWVVDYLVLY